MPYKRQSIQPAHLTVQSISNNAFRRLDEQRTSIHQEDSRRKAPKWEVLRCHSHSCSYQVNSYKRLDYLSPPDKYDLIWDNHIVSGSTCKNVTSGWRAAASWWRDPFPLTPELHHLVSKVFPLRGCWREVAQCNLAKTATRDWYYWLSERALHQLVHSSRLLCKSSWAYVRKTWWFW